MEKLNQDKLRNIILPLAVAKPEMYKKVIATALVVFYLMGVISFLTKGFLTDYIFLEFGIILILLYLVSIVFDIAYRRYYEELMAVGDMGVVIGFSNKLLILVGDDVMDEYEADEIKIRAVTTEESERFFVGYTSVLDCFRNGEIIGSIGVDKLDGYEGQILHADLSRVNEDLVVVYEEDIDDDEDDDDEDDEDLEDLDDDIDEDD